MQCILHIGSAKTGTTSLQSLLYESRETLLGKGWIYPVSCLWHGDRSHNTLGMYFWDNLLTQVKIKPFDEVLSNLLAEIRGHNIILSTELIEKAIIHGNENVNILLSALIESGYEIRVVYAIRRHDCYIDSMFKQSVADVYAPFGKTADEFLSEHAQYVTYSKIADAWAATPGVTSVSVIQFLEGDHGDNVARLLESMGRQDVLPPDTIVPTLNKSLDGVYLRLKHYLNKFDLPIDFHLNYNKSLLSVNNGVKTDRISLFSNDERRALMSDFADDIRSLRDRFGIDSGVWLNELESAQVKFAPLGDDEILPALRAVDQVSVDLAEQARTWLERHLPEGGFGQAASIG